MKYQNDWMKKADFLFIAHFCASAIFYCSYLKKPAQTKYHFLLERHETNLGTHYLLMPSKNYGNQKFWNFVKDLFARSLFLLYILFFFWMPSFERNHVSLLEFSFTSGAGVNGQAPYQAKITTLDKQTSYCPRLVQF